MRFERFWGALCFGFLGGEVYWDFVGLWGFFFFGVGFFCLLVWLVFFFHRRQEKVDRLATYSAQNLRNTQQHRGGTNK